MLSFIFMASSVVTHHRPQKPLVSRACPTASGIVCIPPCLFQSKAHTASSLPKAEFQASPRHPFTSKFLELSTVGCQSWGNKGVGERLASHQSPELDGCWAVGLPDRLWGVWKVQPQLQLSGTTDRWVLWESLLWGLWAAQRPETTGSQSQSSQTSLDVAEELRTKGGGEESQGWLIQPPGQSEKGQEEKALGGSLAGESPCSGLPAGKAHSTVPAPRV